MTNETVSEELQKSRQAAFNGAFRGLRYQGFQRSTGGYGTCFVRHPSHTKDAPFCCAIGWLIPDTALSSMYRNIVPWDKVAEPARTAILTPEGGPTQFALQLMEAHDQSRDPETMERRLRSFAKAYNLTIPDEG